MFCFVRESKATDAENMILHCTQKLAAKLPEVSTTPLCETSPRGSWHAHLYPVDRRECVLFCHDTTRYMMFLPGVRKEQFADLGRLHRELFLATLAEQGVAAGVLKRVELALGPASFDSATDRSVLSSMNVARSNMDCLKIRVDHISDLDPLETARWLNERPVTIRGKWVFPADAMLAQIQR